MSVRPAGGKAPRRSDYYSTTKKQAPKLSGLGVSSCQEGDKNMAEEKKSADKLKPAHVSDVVQNAAKVVKAVVYGNAAESGDGYIQHLLAERQTAHMNGDEEAADNITDELRSLGVE